MAFEGLESSLQRCKGYVTPQPSRIVVGNLLILRRCKGESLFFRNIYKGLEPSLQRCKGSHCAFVYMRGVEYPVYAKVVKDLDVHVYPKTKKGADGTKPGCVFFLLQIASCICLLSLIFLAIPHFGTILFFLNFGSASTGLVFSFLRKFAC